MDYAAYIFDLDGTLLDTLPDLVRLTNMVLEQNHWPTRTREEILSYVGDGGLMLLKRAAPQDATDAEIDSAFEYWQRLYPEYGHALTKPYPGIIQVLEALKGQDVLLGVLSNKFDAAVQDVIAHHFPGLFDLVCGESPEIPRKPNPAGLQHMISQMGIYAPAVAYVGDSGTDMTVASEVGAYAVGVTWGYRPIEELLEAGAQCIVKTPGELLSL